MIRGGVKKIRFEPGEFSIYANYLSICSVIFHSSLLVWTGVQIVDNKCFCVPSRSESIKPRQWNILCLAPENRTRIAEYRRKSSTILSIVIEFVFGNFRLPGTIPGSEFEFRPERLRLRGFKTDSWQIHHSSIHSVFWPSQLVLAIVVEVRHNNLLRIW